MPLLSLNTPFCLAIVTWEELRFLSAFRITLFKDQWHHGESLFEYHLGNWNIVFRFLQLGSLRFTYLDLRRPRLRKRATSNNAPLCV